MSELIQVTPSGSVGKQVYSSTRPVIVNQVILTAPTSAASVVIRDGETSGEVKLTVAALAGTTTPVVLNGEGREGKRFDKGLHVKVIGAGALAYLEII